MNRKKKKRFINLSRNKRRPKVYAIKKLIEKSTIYNSMFYGDQYIHGHNGWLDIYFLSKKSKFIFYNVYLITTKAAYKDACEQIAHDKANELVSQDWHLEKNPGKDSSIMVWKYDHKKPLWDGLTWMEFIEREEQKAADSGEIKVRAFIKQQKDYKQGIGLHAQLPVDSFTVENVCKFIQDYWDAGEPENFDFGKDYSYTKAEINWGLDVNQLIAPWEVEEALAKQNESE
jgi:hypothetical protein